MAEEKKPESLHQYLTRLGGEYGKAGKTARKLSERKECWQYRDKFEACGDNYNGNERSIGNREFFKF